MTQEPAINGQPAPPALPKKFTAVDILMGILCWWPVVMVAFGGCIGGALGGGAGAVNWSIYRKAQMPFALKVLLILGIGFAAVGAYLVFVLVLVATVGPPPA